jgi:hypothetical protein
VTLEKAASERAFFLRDGFMGGFIRRDLLGIGP